MGISEKWSCQAARRIRIASAGLAGGRCHSGIAVQSQRGVSTRQVVWPCA